jgi:hypothetical protein
MPVLQHFRDQPSRQSEAGRTGDRHQEQADLSDDDHRAQRMFGPEASQIKASSAGPPDADTNTNPIE